MGKTDKPSTHSNPGSNIAVPTKIDFVPEEKVQALKHQEKNHKWAPVVKRLLEAPPGMGIHFTMPTNAGVNIHNSLRHTAQILYGIKIRVRIVENTVYVTRVGKPKDKAA